MVGERLFAQHDPFFFRLCSLGFIVLENPKGGFAGPALGYSLPHSQLQEIHPEVVSLWLLPGSSPWPAVCGYVSVTWSKLSSAKDFSYCWSVPNKLVALVPCVMCLFTSDEKSQL